MVHVVRRSARCYPVNTSPNPCLNCGGLIVGRSAAAKFCSSNCAEKFHTKEASAKRVANRATPVKPCQQCGKVFNNSQSRIKFCSDKCRHDYWHPEKRA
jgi:site-specific DNA recombinase